PESSQPPSHARTRQQQAKINMLLHGVRQCIDHGLPPLTIAWCVGIWMPHGPTSSGDLSQPGLPEPVILPGPVPHRSPHLSLPAAVEEKLSFTLDLRNAMVDLVRLNPMSTPTAGRPPKDLLRSKADLGGQQPQSLHDPMT